MGKALLIIVLGFSMIFSGVMLNLTANHQRSARAIVVQYEKWIARNASESVTNVAISLIYQNPDSTINRTVTFGGATVTIATQDVTGDSVTHAKTDSITIIATHEEEIDTTTVKLIQPAFSYYYYFSNQWPASLTYSDGDTMNWAIHSNEAVAVSGSPVFLGRVSSYDSSGFSPAGQTPKFYGGAEFGTQNLWPPDLNPLKALPGAMEFFSQVWIRFNSGGTYDWAFNISGPWTNVPLTGHTIIKTTGIGNRIHVWGNVDGKVTLISSDDLVIEGNITCNDSQDYVGLIAERDVIVNYSASAVSRQIKAAIIAMNKFRIENLNTLAISLTLNIEGSLVVNQDEGFAALVNPKPVFRSHNYDPRLRENTPPYFPRLTNRIEQIYRSN